MPVALDLFDPGFSLASLETYNGYNMSSLVFVYIVCTQFNCKVSNTIIKLAYALRINKVIDEAMLIFCVVSKYAF